MQTFTPTGFRCLWTFWHLWEPNLSDGIKVSIGDWLAVTNQDTMPQANRKFRLAKGTLTTHRVCSRSTISEWKTSVIVSVLNYLAGCTAHMCNPTVKNCLTLLQASMHWIWSVNWVRPCISKRMIFFVACSSSASSSIDKMLIKSSSCFDTRASNCSVRPSSLGTVPTWTYDTSNNTIAKAEVRDENK